MSKPRPPRCALGNLMAARPDVDTLKTDGWRRHGIFVVDLQDQRIGWVEKQVISQLGDKLYGKRHSA